MTKPKPQQSPIDPFETHRREYAEHIQRARQSAEITATAAWRELFDGFNASKEKYRMELAGRLSELAETMDRGGICEDDEKAIKDIVKDHAAMREEIEAFHASTVLPIRLPVRDCESVIDDIRAAAGRMRADEPLLHNGIIEAADALVDSLPKARWNHKDGRVEIIDPDE